MICGWARCAYDAYYGTLMGRRRRILAGWKKRVAEETLETVTVALAHYQSEHPSARLLLNTRACPYNTIYAREKNAWIPAISRNEFLGDGYERGIMARDLGFYSAAVGLDSFSWTRDKRYLARPVTIVELAKAYWVVCCRSDSDVADMGLSYAAFAQMYVKLGSGNPHRGKIAALLNALVKLEFIELEGGHSPKGIGNVYRPS